MKTDFSNGCRATFDGLRGWARAWVVQGNNQPTGLEDNTRRYGVMFWVDKLLIPSKCMILTK